MASTDRELLLLHFNDVYNVTHNKRARPEDACGGAARFATLLKEFAAQEPIIAFSGDLLGPSELSVTTRGQHMCDVLNEFGVTVAALGNHDLDEGVENFRERRETCRFPWLCANLFEVDGDADVPNEDELEEAIGGCARTLVLERQGIRVGVVGLADPSWVDLLGAVDPNKLRCYDFVEVGRKLGRRLRDEHGCEFIIALTHMLNRNDFFLAQHCEEIDLVLGGHDHEYYINRSHRVPVIKSGMDFQHFNEIRLRLPDRTLLDPATRRYPPDSIGFACIDHPTRLDTPEDPAVLAIITRWASADEARMGEVLGHLQTPLVGTDLAVRTRETALGNMVADLVRRSAGAEVALVNGGFLRGNHSVPQGEFTLRDLRRIFPFRDVVVKLEVSGRRLKQALENAVSSVPSSEGRFVHVSGLTFEYDASRPAGDRVLEASMRVQGVPWSPHAAYSLAVPSYLARGMDGFDMLKPTHTEDTEDLGGGNGGNGAEEGKDARERGRRRDSGVAGGGAAGAVEDASGGVGAEEDWIGVRVLCGPESGQPVTTVVKNHFRCVELVNNHAAVHDRGLRYLAHNLRSFAARRIGPWREQLPRTHSPVVSTGVRSTTWTSDRRSSVTESSPTEEPDARVDGPTASPTEASRPDGGYDAGERDAGFPRVASPEAGAEFASARDALASASTSTSASASASSSSSSSAPSSSLTSSSTAPSGTTSVTAPPNGSMGSAHPVPPGPPLSAGLVAARAIGVASPAWWGAGRPGMIASVPAIRAMQSGATEVSPGPSLSTPADSPHVGLSLGGSGNSGSSGSIHSGSGHSNHSSSNDSSSSPKGLRPLELSRVRSGGDGSVGMRRSGAATPGGSSTPSPLALDARGLLGSHGSLVGAYGSHGGGAFHPSGAMRSWTALPVSETQASPMPLTTPTLPAPTMLGAPTLADEVGNYSRMRDARVEAERVAGTLPASASASASASESAPSSTFSSPTLLPPMRAISAPDLSAFPLRVLENDFLLPADAAAILVRSISLSGLVLFAPEPTPHDQEATMATTEAATTTTATTTGVGEELSRAHATDRPPASPPLPDRLPVLGRSFSQPDRDQAARALELAARVEEAARRAASSTSTSTSTSSSASPPSGSSREDEAARGRRVSPVEVGASGGAVLKAVRSAELVRHHRDHHDRAPLWSLDQDWFGRSSAAAEGELAAEAAPMVVIGPEVEGRIREVSGQIPNPPVGREVFP